MIEFKLPAIGEGVVEGEIVRWLKQPGDAVAANEGIVEVMTDKATVEIPCPQEGVVQEIKAEEGVIAAVGDVLALLGAPGAAVAAAKVATKPATKRSTKPAAAGPASPASTAGGNGHGGAVLATPAARALARESGIDLSQVPSERGRITKGDVERLSALRQTTEVTPPTEPQREAEPRRPSSTPTQVPSTVSAQDETIPFRGIRRRIAQGLVKSMFTAVHFTYVEEVNVTKLVAVRNQARDAAEQEGVSLNYIPFIMKAVIRGLKRFPIVNAELDEDAGQIIVRKQYNIGVATATDNGLIVPVVHGADRMSLLDVASEVSRITEAARSGSATLAELTGSTFTITSLGAIGGLMATPILNYPEVGILGVHAIRKVPIVGDDDQITVGHVMNLSVSLDHRVVDGYEGASFLQEVKRYLEDPTLLLLAGI